MNNLTIKVNNKDDRQAFINKIEKLGCDVTEFFKRYIIKDAFNEIAYLTYHIDTNNWSWSEESDFPNFKELNLNLVTMEEFLNYEKE